MIDIIIIRSNSIVNTPRVKKIARSLRKRYSVLVLGWNRDGISKNLVKDYIVNLELFNLRAPIGKPSLVLYMPLFWTWIFFKLVRHRPQIIHACDLDTVLPCYIYKKIFRKKFVFDICDRYAMAYIPVQFGTLYTLVNLIEELFCKRANLVITVAEKLMATIKKKPKKYTIIMNCCEDHVPIRPDEQEGRLTIAYTGGIRKHRYLENMPFLLKELDNVKLVIAGSIIDKDVFNQIQRTPNIEYKGVLQMENALALEGSCDVILALYDPLVPQNNIAMPNKLFEAMMCGIPIITNIAREIIEETGCGIIVNYDDANQLKQTIIDLRDNLKLRKKMGNKGRRAFIEKYNWNLMENKLFKIYENLSIQ